MNASSTAVFSYPKCYVLVEKKGGIKSTTQDVGSPTISIEGQISNK